MKVCFRLPFAAMRKAPVLLNCISCAIISRRILQQISLFRSLTLHTNCMLHSLLVFTTSQRIATSVHYSAFQQLHIFPRLRNPRTIYQGGRSSVPFIREESCTVGGAAQWLEPVYGATNAHGAGRDPSRFPSATTTGPSIRP